MSNNLRLKVNYDQRFSNKYNMIGGAVAGGASSGSSRFSPVSATSSEFLPPPPSLALPVRSSSSGASSPRSPSGVAPHVNHLNVPLKKRNHLDDESQGKNISTFLKQLSRRNKIVQAGGASGGSFNNFDKVTVDGKGASIFGKNADGTYNIVFDLGGFKKNVSVREIAPAGGSSSGVLGGRSASPERRPSSASGHARSTSLERRAVASAPRAPSPTAPSSASGHIGQFLARRPTGVEGRPSDGLQRRNFNGES